MLLPPVTGKQSFLHLTLLVLAQLLQHRGTQFHQTPTGAALGFIKHQTLTSNALQLSLHPQAPGIPIQIRPA